MLIITITVPHFSWGTLQWPVWVGPTVRNLASHTLCYFVWRSAVGARPPLLNLYADSWRDQRNRMRHFCQHGCLRFFGGISKRRGNCCRVSLRCTGTALARCLVGTGIVRRSGLLLWSASPRFGWQESVRSCSRARVFFRWNPCKMLQFIDLPWFMVTGDGILCRNAIFLPVFNIEH